MTDTNEAGYRFDPVARIADIEAACKITNEDRRRKELDRVNALSLLDIATALVTLGGMAAEAGEQVGLLERVAPVADEVHEEELEVGDIVTLIGQGDDDPDGSAGVPNVGTITALGNTEDEDYAAVAWADGSEAKVWLTTLRTATEEEAALMHVETPVKAALADAERCPAVTTLEDAHGEMVTERCTRPTGHKGKHEDAIGTRWKDAD